MPGQRDSDRQGQLDHRGRQGQARRDPGPHQGDQGRDREVDLGLRQREAAGTAREAGRRRRGHQRGRGHRDRNEGEEGPGGGRVASQPRGGRGGDGGGGGGGVAGGRAGAGRGGRWGR